MIWRKKGLTVDLNTFVPTLHRHAGTETCRYWDMQKGREWIWKTVAMCYTASCETQKITEFFSLPRRYIANFASILGRWYKIDWGGVHWRFGRYCVGLQEEVRHCQVAWSYIYGHQVVNEPLSLQDGDSKLSKRLLAYKIDTADVENVI